MNVIYGSAAGLPPRAPDLDAGQRRHPTRGRRRATTSGSPWRWGTSTATASPTWPSVSGEDLAAVDRRRPVNVIYGSAAGLTAAGNQLWYQDIAGIDGVAEAGDQFGACPGGRRLQRRRLRRPGRRRARARTSARSSTPARSTSSTARPAGLTAAGDQFWHQDSRRHRGRRPRSATASGPRWRRGTSTATASTTWPSACPARTSARSSTPGRVNVLYGSAAGLAAAGNSSGARTSPGSGYAPRTVDFFGSARPATSTATASTTWPCGVPHRDVGTRCGRRAVNVLYGSAAGLAAAGDQLWTRTSPAPGRGRGDG